MNKKIASLTITGSLLGGSLLGATVFAPNVAFGQDAEPSTVEGVEVTESAAPFADWVAEALQGLVDDGTITEFQSGAVADALTDARPDRSGLGHFARHRGGIGRLDTLTETLGIDAEDLLTSLREGNTIAETATANGVEPQAVIDALVAEQTAKIEDAISSGRIDEERAGEVLAGLEERVENFVNREGRLRGLFGPGTHRHGHPGAGSIDDGTPVEGTSF